MSKVFVDTSAYFASIRNTEADHGQARVITLRLADEGDMLYTSNFVIAEAHALLLNRIGRVDAARFLEAIIAGSRHIIRVLEADETQAREIIRRPSDKDYSYTDATSFAIVERLHIKKVFSFDQHFAQYGFTLIH
jgi:uncharacterized protein